MSFSGETIVAKLIGTAAARVGDIVGSKLLRISRIEAALSTGTRKERAVKTALNDFETVLGSAYGLLTSDINDFLRELERTGLITAIAEAAILEVQPPEVRDAFVHLHDQMIPGGNAPKLYDSLFLALTTSFRYLTKDSSLDFLTRASAKDLRTRIETVSGQLAAHFAKPALIASPKEAAPTIERILKSASSEFQSIRVETNRGPRIVDIAKIFIPSKLRKEPPSSHPARTRPTRRRRTSDGETFPLWRDDVLHISYDELKRTFQRVVVLGDPGGGKSTLCQFLCNELAKKSSLHYRHPDRIGQDAATQRVPIRIVLRHFERARAQQSQLGVFDYICNEIRATISEDLATIQSALRYLLTFGRAAIAFDGLDEILNVSQRREFVQLVSMFCDQYPLCPVIVTSRVVGYEEAPLPSNFEILGLERFEEDEIRLFVQKFLKVYAPKEILNVEERADDFIKQTETNAADLRQNPLMLGLMTILFAHDGDIPNNRPEIYKECALLMFEKWDKRRGIEAAIPQFDYLDLFRALAAKIFGNRELETGVSADWIFEQTRKYLSGYFIDKASAHSHAKQVADFITGRSWVMAEFGPNAFRFTHRTFLEFFFAQHLEHENETLGSLLEALEPKIASQQWDVICHLAIQIKTGRNNHRTAEALRYMTNMVSESRTPNQRKAILNFAAKSLAYLTGTQHDVRALINKVIDTEIVSDDGSLEAIIQCCHTALQHRQFAAAVISDRLHASLLKNGPERSNAALLIGTPLERLYFGGAHNERIRTQVPAAVRSLALSSTRAHNLSVSRSNSQDALRYWLWYRDHFEELFSAYGLALFAQGKQFRGGNFAVYELWVILNRACDMPAGQIQTALSQEDAVSTLSRIGKMEIVRDTLTKGHENELEGVLDHFTSWDLIEEKIVRFSTSAARGLIIALMVCFESDCFARSSVGNMVDQNEKARDNIANLLRKALVKKMDDATRSSFSAIETWLAGEWRLIRRSRG